MSGEIKRGRVVGHWNHPDGSPAVFMSGSGRFYFAVPGLSGYRKTEEAAVRYVCARCGYEVPDEFEPKPVPLPEPVDCFNEAGGDVGACWCAIEDSFAPDAVHTDRCQSLRRRVVESDLREFIAGERSWLDVGFVLA